MRYKAKNVPKIMNIGTFTYKKFNASAYKSIRLRLSNELIPEDKDI